MIQKRHIKAFELLNKYRVEAGVSSCKYLWADPNKKRYEYFRAHYVLLNFCKQHSFDPKLMAATKFRYHLASATSKMDKVKQSVISKFMGHTDAIHQQIYQKQPLLSVFTMGDILMACNGVNSQTKTVLPVAEILNDIRSSNWLEKDEIRQIIESETPYTSEPSQSVSVDEEIVIPRRTKPTVLSPILENTSPNSQEEPIPSTSRGRHIDYDYRPPDDD